MVELVRRLGWSYVSTVAAEVNNPVNLLLGGNIHGCVLIYISIVYIHRK